MGAPTPTAHAPLAIHFLVVGGSISGLAAALALARVGHRVTVLERHAEDAPLPAGGLRLPPNVTKVFERWGLASQLAAISADSRTLRFYTYAQGEYLGYGAWDDEMLRETGGEFLIAAYADVRALLLTAARANGALVRFGTLVEGVDEELAHITLADGEVVKGDVIVGADGSKGALRNLVFEGEEQVGETGLALCNMTIPIEHLDADPMLRDLLVDNSIGLWLGDGCHAYGLPVRSGGVYALHLYLPRPILRKIPISDRWGAPAVDLVNLMLATRTAEPRLRTLLMMASAASVVAYDAHQALDDEEDWVLLSAPGVLLGDAAHPTPPGSVQASAVALEDAAVFAKLFSHLRRRDQIPSLLSGFAGLRAERARLVLEADAQLIGLFAMPYDATGIAQGRDDAFRTLTKAGRKVAGEADGDAASNEQWYQTLMTWAYDAEDDADDWWMKWGVIAERGQDNPQALGFDFGASITHVSASERSGSERSYDSDHEAL